MSEAEILAIRNDVTGLVVSVVSVSFGMISAYIAGLWLFLREAPISLRLLAFGLLSCGLAFMGALTAGLNGLLIGTEVREGLAMSGPQDDIVVVADGVLARNYAEAFAAAGRTARIEPPDAVFVAGLLRLVALAGL